MKFLLQETENELKPHCTIASIKIFTIFDDPDKTITSK